MFAVGFTGFTSGKIQGMSHLTGPRTIHSGSLSMFGEIRFWTLWMFGDHIRKAKSIDMFETYVVRTSITICAFTALNYANPLIVDLVWNLWDAWLLAGNVNRLLYGIDYHANLCGTSVNGAFVPHFSTFTYQGSDPTSRGSFPRSRVDGLLHLSRVQARSQTSVAGTNYSITTLPPRRILCRQVRSSVQSRFRP